MPNNYITKIKSAKLVALTQCCIIAARYKIQDKIQGHPKWPPLNNYICEAKLIMTYY
jgi:hypothetical protein